MQTVVAGMVSTIIYISSQEVPNRNLVNSNKENYCVVLMLCFVIAWRYVFSFRFTRASVRIRGDHASFIKRQIMVKVQIASVITLDGYLPEREDSRLLWIENNRKGFPLWRDLADRILAGEVSFLTFINQKRTLDTNYIYLAELQSRQQLPLVKGLFAYGLVDEVILYVLPVTIGKGIQTTLISLSVSKWSLKNSRTFPNGISLLVYSKIA